MRHHNEYIVGTLQRPGAPPFTDARRGGRQDRRSATAPRRRSAPPTTWSRPIKSVLEISGGFGTVVGFVHDWANPENTRRSWDMVARYVVPEINGYLAKLRKSHEFVIENRAVFDRAGQAVMAKITENDRPPPRFRSPVPAVSRSRPSMHRTCRRKPRNKTRREARGRASARIISDCDLRKLPAAFPGNDKRAISSLGYADDISPGPRR